MQRAILFTTLAALVALPAAAVTLRVPSEYPTINGALDAAAYGDTVLVAPGTYTDAQTRVVDIGGAGSVTVTCLAVLKDGVVLRSEAGPEVTILDLSLATIVGQGWVVVGGLMPSEETVLEGFTITGAPVSGRGVRIKMNGKVTIRDCAFQDLNAGGGTGAGVEAGWSDVDMISCSFAGCIAGLGGGAVMTTYSNVLMEFCTVASCSATGGGGGVALNGDDFSPRNFVIRGCVFRDNATASGGGGIAQGDDGFAMRVVEDCWFENNRAESGGGALIYGNCPSTEITGNVFVRNATSSPGAGISVKGNPVVVEGNTFHACSQSGTYRGGSGFYAPMNSRVILRNNIFTENAGSEAAGMHPTSYFIDYGCNVYWANHAGNAYGFSLHESDRIVDPLYCDSLNDDFFVAANSPCLPENSGGCGLIGAFGQGCGAIAIEPTSWARLKARYR